MKLRDILPPQQLDEINLKQAIAAGMIGATALSPRPSFGADKTPQRPAISHQVKEHQDMIQAITSRFNVDPWLAKHIVTLAHKYEHADFPSAEDILAIIGVESKFKPGAKSQLAKDPALGLMQIRPGVWKIPPHELMAVDSNIKHGANILRHYYEELKDENAAIQAYNVGITRYRAGKKNPSYLHKVKSELASYEDAAP